MSQEKVAGILGVAQQTIDLWEGISITSDSNTYNPPDLRVKILKKEKQRIKERVVAGDNWLRVYNVWNYSSCDLQDFMQNGKYAENHKPDLDDVKNGISAENHQPDPLSFTCCRPFKNYCSITGA